MRPLARRTARSSHWSAGGLAAALVAGAGLAAAPHPPAEALPAACPRVLPVGQVRRGMAVTGLTTGTGSKPERFDGEVLGTLVDGIAPGLPMILIRARSRTIDKAGGIWAGMSGSPVYARDGRLIGAVAYGLAAGPSKIAGLTPAEPMMELLARGGAAGAALPAAGAGHGAQDADASGSASMGLAPAPAVASGLPAGGELRQLPMPLGLSGFGGARFGQVGRAVARSRRLNALAYQAAAVPLPAAAAAPAPVRPGGNFAAALSYGDVTAAGIGTATIACDGVAVAFGHPFLFAGATTMSAHGATTITIQDDPARGPFKVANAGAVVGTVTADRLAGIRARLGGGPRPIVLTSTVTDRGLGRSRHGQTNVNVGEFVPTMAASHLLANVDRVFDQVGPGRSVVTWTATGAFGNGRPWRLTRGNRFSSRTDTAFESAAELLDFLTILRDNEFETVRFDTVAITADLAPQPRELRVGSVQWKGASGAFRPLGPGSRLRVRPGEVITLRARLDSVRNVTTGQTVELRVKVPAGAAGHEGSLSVSGGLTPETATFECLFDPALCPTKVGGRSADDVLRLLSTQPRNDDVVATLRFDADDPASPGGNPDGGDLKVAGPLDSSATARARDVVRGLSASVPVVVAKAAPTTGARAGTRAAPRLLAPPRRPIAGAS